MRPKLVALLFLGPMVALAAPEGSFEKSMPDDPCPDRANVTAESRPWTPPA